MTLLVSEEGKNALYLIEKGQSAFITGHAGTGKSTLLRHFRDTTKKSVIVLAPTGLAAINIGGQTVHSFFKFPPKFIDSSTIKRGRHAELIRKLDTVILDEVSMLRVDLMEGIDKALRVNREQDVPFGGAQVVFFGDLFQLPPVVREPELRDYFDAHYGGPYFFLARAFDTCLPYFELTRTYRQRDEDFIALLNRIRHKEVDGNTLTSFNKRVGQRLPDPYVTLTTTNEAALQRNRAYLERLKGKLYVYHAAITGRFDPSAYPTESALELKQGAQVLMIRNDADKRWVNGTIATVGKITSKKVHVEVDGKSYEVEPDLWENIEYVYDSRTIKEQVVGRFEQYSLRLAWAITIHKSQGQTFERVFIDFSLRAFAHGQTYVALSRCTSLEGISLSWPVGRADIIVDERVYGFEGVFRKVTFDRFSPSG